MSDNRNKRDTVFYVLFPIIFVSLILMISGCSGEATQPSQKPKVIRGKITDLRKYMDKEAQDSKKYLALAPKKVKIHVVPPKRSLKKKEVITEKIHKTEVKALSGYDPKGKIDPFKPLVRESTEEMVPLKSKRRKHLTPLEKLDIGQLKLVGIIRIPDGNIAMIEEVSGKGYVVKKDTYIGLNSGQISKILKDKVVIEEKFEDFKGKTVIRKKELKLQKPLG